MPTEHYWRTSPPETSLEISTPEGDIIFAFTPSSSRSRATIGTLSSFTQPAHQPHAALCGTAHQPTPRLTSGPAAGQPTGSRRSAPSSPAHCYRVCRLRADLLPVPHRPIYTHGDPACQFLCRHKDANSSTSPRTGNVEISFFLKTTYKAISYHAHVRAYQPTHFSPHLQCSILPSTGLQCTIQPSTGLQCSEYFPSSIFRLKFCSWTHRVLRKLPL
jgi:hypothetical protein